jgi:Predicted membrane protein
MDRPNDKKTVLPPEAPAFLECERKWVYWCLIAAAGWFGAYTFLLRGGVFCNAQTANIVLFAMAVGRADAKGALYLLIPISAYFAGAFFSEYMGKSVKKLHFLRWDTILIGVEIIAVVILGLLPKSVPDQVCQIALNFICSMQFNTFRQLEGTPAATTFVTNHIRQVGSSMAKYLRHRDAASAARIRTHGAMIFFFFTGGVAGTLFAGVMGLPSLCGSALILLPVFLRLAHADRSYEKDLLSRIPRGH